MRLNLQETYYKNMGERKRGEIQERRGEPSDRNAFGAPVQFSGKFGKAMGSKLFVRRTLHFLGMGLP